MLNIFKERKILKEEIQRLEDNLLLKNKQISKLQNQKETIKIAKDINESRANKLEKDLKDINLKYRKRNNALGGLRKANNKLKNENEMLQNQIIEITNKFERQLRAERAKKRVIGIKELRNPELIDKVI